VEHRREGVLVTAAPLAVRHGTVTGYTARRCRCDECRAAWADYMRLYNQGRRRTTAQPAECPTCGRHISRPGAMGRHRVDCPVQHGIISRYLNGCRCADCRRVAADHRRQARIRAAERAGRQYGTRRGQPIFRDWVEDYRRGWIA
jgi:hypothetical protein